MKAGNKNHWSKTKQKGSYEPFLDETFLPQTFFQYKSLQSACHVLLVILDYNLLKSDALFLFMSMHCQV